MKKIIKNTIIFLLPIIICSYIIDAFISIYLKKSNERAFGEYTVWNDVFEGKINSDVFIYGSSRAWVHINPEMISDRLHVSVYNLGINGHNFWLQYLRHKQLLKYNKKPKIIVLSLDYITLGKQLDLYNSEQFLPYMLWNKEIKESTIAYKGFSSLDYEIPLIRYYGQTTSIKTAIKFFIGHPKNSLGRIKGYKGADKLWNSDFDKAKLSMTHFKIELDTQTIALFEQFLNECKSKDIKLIFVYSPEYIEGQRFVKNRSQFMSIYKKYSKQYQIPFYDFSNDSISYHKKYFYNASHLNKLGSELFTSRLIDTLLYSDVVKKLKNID